MKYNLASIRAKKISISKQSFVSDIFIDTNSIDNVITISIDDIINNNNIITINAAIQKSFIDDITIDSISELLISFIIFKINEVYLEEIIISFAYIDNEVLNSSLLELIKNKYFKSFQILINV